MAIFKNLHDPGLGEKFLTGNRRIINKDGSFNVKRIGLDSVGKNLYYYLINISWLKFLGLMFGSYVLINIAFALIYTALGVGHLQGADMETPFSQFMSALFFSFQTFTSVGYGAIAPKGMMVSLVSSAEAFVGLSSFALLTGLIFARFARPSSKILFSENALISPYRDGLTSLQFRIANRRHNVLMELEAKVMLMAKDKYDPSRRIYYSLPLETAYIHFFPLNWTLVHPINDESPLMGMSAKEMQQLDIEILILIKGFDDTFGQVVYTRYSYKFNEIVHNAKFRKAYDTDEHGVTVMDINNIHAYDLLEANVEVKENQSAAAVAS
ncbi:MAG: ion channel [Chitinophagales bacterium]|nr:ion channel [Chitinophagales bacterium]